VETAKGYLDRLSRGAGQDAGFLTELSAAYDRLASVEGSRSGSGSQLHQDQAAADFDRSLALIRRAAAIDSGKRAAPLKELRQSPSFKEIART
jgi:hypothetical protein